MSLLEMHSWADVRALVYTLLPIASTLAVTYGVADESQVALWVGLVAALLGPGIAFLTSRSVSTFRPAFYAVLAAGQAVAVGYGLVTDAQVGVWVPLVSALIGGAAGGVANANTATSSPFSRGSNRGEADPTAPVAR
ncbi:MAG: hypothetical protein QM662_17920 [Gordonia sp. (in: high G+C Gram-positive bacteria)]